MPQSLRNSDGKSGEDDLFVVALMKNQPFDCFSRVFALPALVTMAE